MYLFGAIMNIRFPSPPPKKLPTQRPPPKSKPPAYKATSSVSHFSSSPSASASSSNFRYCAWQSCERRGRESAMLFANRLPRARKLAKSGAVQDRADLPFARFRRSRSRAASLAVRLVKEEWGRRGRRLRALRCR